MTRARARRPSAALALLAGVAFAVSCGGDERIVTTTVVQTVTAPAEELPGMPDIGERPAKKGEVVIRGDEAPRTYGPYDFEPGPYTFRFAQYVPGGGVDFASEASSFSAIVNRKAGTQAPDSQILANVTARAGAGTVNLSGKLYVEVQSADYAYVMRFTPVDQ